LPTVSLKQIDLAVRTFDRLEQKSRLLKIITVYANFAYRVDVAEPMRKL
jgi:hypothetical protein